MGWDGMGWDGTSSAVEEIWDCALHQGLFLDGDVVEDMSYG